MRKFVLSVLALLVFSASTAVAQSAQFSGTVTGDDGPIAGAVVNVKGTNVGAVTNPSGKYSIRAGEGDILVFSFMGMKNQEMTVNSAQTTIDVKLVADAINMDQVVITALGISRAEKSLGYASTSLSGDELTLTRSSDVSSSLAGKVAGVQVSTVSSDPGASTSVIIRGISSLTNGANQPLYVVDGIPMVNNRVGESTSLNGSLDFGNGANMINPDDVESMTILKGAAATALYGSRASAGVILITTKSGKTSDGINIDVNSGVKFSTVNVLPTMQNEYGMGWYGMKTDDENGSWGPKFDGKMRLYGAVNTLTGEQLMKPYVSQPNNVRDFFDTGVMYNNSVSVSGGQDNTTFFGSYSNISDNGILPGKGDTYNRNTFSLRGDHTWKWLKVGAAMNLSNQKTNFVSSGQGYNVVNSVYQTPRDININNLKDLDNQFNTPQMYYTPYSVTNPYWLIANKMAKSDQKKIFGKFQTDVNILKNLKAVYRFGFDYSDSDIRTGEPKIQDGMGIWASGSALSKANGSAMVEFSRAYEFNHDVFATYQGMVKSIKFDYNVTVGMNANERGRNLSRSIVNDLTIPTFYDLSNTGSSAEVRQIDEKRRLVGVFADVQVGWNQMLYLNLTARNDWSSTLPQKNNSFFYPGVTGSFIFTELIKKNNILDFGKLRLAWGKTGNDAGYYMVNPFFVKGVSRVIYTTDAAFPIAGLNAFKQGAIMGSQDLSPEMTTEAEVGLNLKMFKGRVNIDAAYYNKVSDQQIFELAIDPASGFLRQNTNLGQISNKGFELLIGVVPVRTKDFRWDFSVNYTRNRNRIESIPADIGGDIQFVSFGNDVTGVKMIGREGHPVGIYLTNGYKRDPQGRLIVDANTGSPVAADELEYRGQDMNHNYEMGISNAFSYKGFTLAVDFDFRQGGYIYSQTASIMNFTGNGIATLYNDRRTFIVPNSVNEFKNAAGESYYVENVTPITSEYIFDYNDLGRDQGGFANLIDRSYVKLRQASLSYDFPRKLVSRIGLKALRLSVVGNNLFVWLPKENTFLDPELSTNGTDIEGRFGEYYANPSTRSIGFNIQIKL